MESKLFRIGMYWRMFYGTIRILIGLTLLKLINVPLLDVLHNLMGNEVNEDPSDLLFTIANYFLQLHPLTVTYFISAYLIFWGVLDIFMSAALLKHKIWAFRMSMWLIAFFVIYELFRFTHTHSLILLGVVMIDIFIFFIIKREYQKNIIITD